MMPACEQRDLWGLLPGVVSRRTLRDRRGPASFGTLGTIGGQTTLTRYGPEHMRELARRGAARRCQQWDFQPRTIHSTEAGQVVTERVNLFWPHDPRRRKAPLPVRIALVCVPVEICQEACHVAI